MIEGNRSAAVKREGGRRMLLGNIPTSIYDRMGYRRLTATPQMLWALDTLVFGVMRDMEHKA